MQLFQLLQLFQLFQLEQFKFEHHETRHYFLHSQNQNRQRKRHLHQNYFLHLHQFQAFQWYQRFDSYKTGVSPRIPHFHLTYNHSQ